MKHLLKIDFYIHHKPYSQKPPIKNGPERENKDSPQPDKEPGARAESTNLHMIGIMLSLLIDTPLGRIDIPFKNKAALVDAMLTLGQDKPGISSRTLYARFASAERHRQNS
jgi:hypothetical protein